MTNTHGLSVLACMGKADGDGRVQGMLVGPNWKEPVAFAGYGELVLRLDEMCSQLPELSLEWEPRFLDSRGETGYRERTRRLRKIFDEKPDPDTLKQAVWFRKMKSFPVEEILEIRVESRIYGSIQGLIRGSVTRNRYIGYRSGLELMRMLSLI